MREIVDELRRRKIAYGHSELAAFTLPEDFWVAYNEYPSKKLVVRDGVEVQGETVKLVTEERCTGIFYLASEVFPDLGRTTSSLGAVGSTIFWSESGECGLDWHQDPTNVLVVQLSGSKTWQIGSATSRDPILWEGELKAGDVLAAPWDFWHRASPRGRSVHLSLLFPRY